MATKAILITMTMLSVILVLMGMWYIQHDTWIALTEYIPWPDTSIVRTQQPSLKASIYGTKEYGSMRYTTL
jgi:hypothetical protein